ncbi:GDSL esterase/lipase, partial [Ananas comosus]
RAFYIFGDSLVDSGNNNYLATTARADQPPYGIDFPSRRPTGRFSNGLNVPDIISEHIGSERVLPYLSPELDGEKLLIGANFASAGIGILNDTGIQFVIRPITKTTSQHNQDHKAAALLCAMLYELGARQVLVTGVGPLGCVPAELALRSRTGQCDPELQRVPDMYNPQLVQMIREVNAEIGSDVFVAVNAYRMHMDFISNPRQY